MVDPQTLPLFSFVSAQLTLHFVLGQGLEISLIICGAAAVYEMCV